MQYGRNAARAYRRVPDITLWQTTVNSQLTDEQATALETKMRQSASQPPLDEWHSLSRWAIPGGAQSQSAPNKPGNTPEKSDGERASDKRNQRARMVPVMRRMPATQPRAISSHPNHIPSTLLTPAQSVTQVSPQRAVIDINGSTGDDVLGAQRVIDIERIAALVATAAFDAPGDDYSILAFSSAGPSNVRVHTLKQFGEKNSAVVLQRMIGGNR